MKPKLVALPVEGIREKPRFSGGGPLVFDRVRSGFLRGGCAPVPLPVSLGAGDGAADDGLPIRPKPARIRRPGDSLTSEEAGLHRRLEDQVLRPSEPEAD